MDSKHYGRNKEMARLYRDQGMTLSSIGRMFGLSGAGVRSAVRVFEEAESPGFDIPWRERLNAWLQQNPPPAAEAPQLLALLQDDYSQAGAAS